MFRFGQRKWIGEGAYCAKKIQVLLCSNTTVCGNVNLKNNIEEFQRSQVPFSFGILVHLNELQDDDGIIQNLKK